MQCSYEHLLALKKWGEKEGVIKKNIFRGIKLPKRSKEHMDSRREQVLKAAKICFSQKGFHATTIRTICTEAGLSTGAVYLHFQNKDEIIGALAERNRENNRALIDSVGVENPVMEEISQLAKLYFLDMLRAPDAGTSNRFSVNLFSEAAQNPRVRHYLETSVKDLSEAISRMIAKAQERGEVNTNLAPDTIAQFLMSLFVGFRTLTIPYPEMDIDEFVNGTMEIFAGRFLSRARE